MRHRRAETTALERDSRAKRFRALFALVPFSVRVWLPVAAILAFTDAVFAQTTKDNAGFVSPDEGFQEPVSGNSGTNTGGASPIGVREVYLFRDNNGKIGQQVKFFEPGDKIQHFQISLSQALNEAPVGWRFIAVNTSVGRNQIVFQSEKMVSGNVLFSRLTNDSPWPVGDYRAEVYALGKLVKAFNYRIQSSVAANDRIEVTEILIYTDTRNTPLTTVLPSHHRLFYAARLKGNRTTPVRVRWMLSAVNTEGGSGVLLDQDLPNVYIEGNELSSFAELPRDWPKGTYRVDLWIDGVLLKSLEYAIQ